MPRKRLDPTSVATKTSITLDAATMAILRARSGPGENASGLVRLLLGWYDEIIRRERPDLAPNEWNAIRDALNGTWLLAEQWSLGMIASALALEVSDACRLNGLADKWKVDGPGLVARLAAMSFAARVAVIDDVVRFWAEAGREEAAPVEVEIVGAGPQWVEINGHRYPADGPNQIGMLARHEFSHGEVDFLRRTITDRVPVDPDGTEFTIAGLSTRLRPEHFADIRHATIPELAAAIRNQHPGATVEAGDDWILVTRDGKDGEE